MKDRLTWETTEIADEDEPENEGTVVAEPVAPNPFPVTPDGRPDPKWVRGRCPECGDDLVSNLYYVGGKGYLCAWECWSSLRAEPACNYRRVL